MFEFNGKWMIVYYTNYTLDLHVSNFGKLVLVIIISTLMIMEFLHCVGCRMLKISRSCAVLWTTTACCPMTFHHSRKEDRFSPRRKSGPSRLVLEAYSSFEMRLASLKCGSGQSTKRELLLDVDDDIYYFCIYMLPSPM